MKAYETTTKNENRSERYHHVTTKDIGDTFERHGFNLVKYGQSKTKNELDQSHAKHLARFRSTVPNLKIGDSVPELIIQNDGLGLRSLRISYGLFRLVCSNGLVIGNKLYDIRLNHDKNIMTNLDRVIPELLSSADHLQSLVQDFQAIETTEKQRLDLAYSASLVQIQNSSLNIQNIDLNQYLSVRRWDDNKTDAWTVFNRIQENVFRKQIRALILNEKGDQEFQNLKRVGENSQRALEVNKQLWTSATEVLKIGA